MSSVLRSSLIVFTLSITATIAAAQDARPGRIVGRVIDASNGEPVPGAQVTVAGRVITAMTDWSGRYALDGVPAGLCTLIVRAIGYAQKSVTDIAVPDGGTVPLNVTLAASAVQIEAVEVTAEMERGSVTQALNPAPFRPSLPRPRSALLTPRA